MIYRSNGIKAQREFCISLFFLFHFLSLFFSLARRCSDYSLFKVYDLIIFWKLLGRGACSRLLSVDVIFHIKLCNSPTFHKINWLYKYTHYMLNYPAQYNKTCHAAKHPTFFFFCNEQHIICLGEKRMHNIQITF